MPQTIVIPTQAQLAQWHNSPTSLLSMYQAAHNTPQAVLNPSAALSGSGGPATGSNVATQAPPWALPGYDPSVFKITAPDMPAWKDIQAPAIPQNNMDWVKSTTDMINQINQQAQQSANAGRIPGGAGLEGQSSANIHNALAGQLPSDVINQIGQQAAERGVSSGSPWGANSNADYLKAIGLNSLQLQNTGQDWLSAATNRNPAAPIFDPSKLLITPAQQAQFGLEGANLNLANERGRSDASNSNAARQLQASLANASNQQERDRLMLQYTLANTQNQFERDKLLSDFQQRELDRQNALRIAGLRNQNGYGGYPHTGGGSNGGGGFNPATNWYSGSPVSGTSSSSNTPWHLPYSLDGNNQLPNDYLDQFYNQGTNPPVTTPSYDTTPSDWNNLLPSMSPDYGGPGGLSDEDYFNLYGG